MIRITNSSQSILENIIRAFDDLHEIVDPLDEFTWINCTNKVFIDLDKWSCDYPIIEKFYFFDSTVNKMIEECKMDLDNELEVYLLSSMLNEVNGIDLVEFAIGESGSKFAYDTSFPFFKACEDMVEKTRAKMAKHDHGKDKGYIYALSNDSMPKMLKIGFTHRNPEKRVSELSSHTGVPTPFKLLYYKYVLNCQFIEEMVHKKLKNYRVSNNREFFKITIEKVKKIIDDCIRETY